MAVSSSSVDSERVEQESVDHDGEHEATHGDSDQQPHGDLDIVRSIVSSVGGDRGDVGVDRDVFRGAQHGEVVEACEDVW